VTSITVTTAGTGYTIGDTVTFAAVSGSTGHDHPQIDYVLVAADFDAFTASGVTTVSGKCSGNLATATDLAEVAADGTFQYACGSGFTVKASTVALSGGDSAAKKTACCTEHEKCGAADTCPANWGAKTSAAATHCAGLSCARATTDKTACCSALSCKAKTDNEWAALGLTVATAAGTDVAGLGAIGAAAGWSEDTTDSAAAACAGGAALAALTGGTLPTITNGVAATYSGVASTSSGSGTGLVADIVVASATALTSITVTTAGSGYSIDDTVTFAAASSSYDEIVYTLKAADFAAFTAAGVTEVSGKCSGNLQTATNLATQVGGLYQYNCGTGYTVKASTVALSGDDSAAMKTACCTADTTTCDAAAPATTNMANMVNVGGVAKGSIANACDGTATDATCANTCAAGYTGGSVTCGSDGAWVVVDCTVAPTTTAAPEPETPAPAPATLPDNSASTEITSVIAVVTVIAAALAGL
jgi:translation initiation factor 1 (eIF-1/SUI1)